MLVDSAQSGLNSKEIYYSLLSSKEIVLLETQRSESRAGSFWSSCLSVYTVLSELASLKAVLSHGAKLLMVCIEE